MNTPLDNPTTRISVEVNGSLLTRDVECRKHLVDFLREDCGLKGSHLGCEHGVCGACTVRLDGRIVRGCLVLAAQASGHRVETVETPTPSPRLRALQDAFVEFNALQCGFCTPGMLMAALELVERKPDADREQVRQWMSGNYCRCTGYHAIVDAVCAVLEQQRAGRLPQARPQAAWPPPPEGDEQSGQATFAHERPQGRAAPSPPPEGNEQSGQATFAHEVQP